MIHNSPVCVRLLSLLPLCHQIAFLKVSRWRIYKKWNSSIEGTRINVPALFLPIKRPFVCSGLAQTLGKSHEPSISIKRASAPGHDPLVFSAHPGLRNLRCLPLLKERRGEIARLRTQRMPRTAADCWRVNFTHDYLPGYF